MVQGILGCMGRNTHDGPGIILQSVQKYAPRAHIITAGAFTQLPPVFEKVAFEAPQFSVDHK